MAVACKICIKSKGIRGSDKLFETQEELNDHLESYHHMPVIRKGESKEEAIKRFLKNYPAARKCPKCIAEGAPWTKITF